MAEWQIRTKQSVRSGNRCATSRGRHAQELHHACRIAAAERRASVPTESRRRPAVVEVVAWALPATGTAAKTPTISTASGGCARSIRGFSILTKRIDAAVVVDPAAPRPGSACTRVFFGATVTYKDAAGLEHVVSIVGIDEVDLDRCYFSWCSPLANALMKASPGDRVELRAPAKTEHLEIIGVKSTRRFRWILSANRRELQSAFEGRRLLAQAALL